MRLSGPFLETLGGTNHRKARVRFPADAFQLCGQQFGIPLILHRVLQTKTNDMAVFEDLCAKAMLMEAVLQHLASDMRGHSPKP